MPTSSIRYFLWRMKSRLASTPEGFWDLSLPSWHFICTFVVPHAKFILNRHSKPAGKGYLVIQMNTGFDSKLPCQFLWQLCRRRPGGLSLPSCHTASPEWWHPVEGWRWGQAVTDATRASQFISFSLSPKPTSFRSLLQRILDVGRMFSLTSIPTQILRNHLYLGLWIEWGFFDVVFFAQGPCRRHFWYSSLVESIQYKQECFRFAIKILKHVIAILGNKTVCVHEYGQ